MIGARAFCFELIPLFFPLIFVAVGVLAVKKKEKVGYFFVVFGCTAWLLMTVRYSHQAQNHMILGSLASSEVSAIQVGDTVLSGEDQLRPVLEALTDKEWFRSDHGGWADTVPLVITHKDGTTVRFRVGYYLRQEGAVIEFFRGSESSYWADGYAFCPRLPTALGGAGVRLPSQPGGS